MGKPPTGQGRTTANNAAATNSSKSRSPKQKSATGGNRKPAAQNAAGARNAASGGNAPKRSRPSGVGRDTKRARMDAGSKPSTPRSGTPQSPSSSRSRPRKQSGGTNSNAASVSGAGASAATGATGNGIGGARPSAVKARASAGVRQVAPRNTILQQANVNLTIEGMSAPSDIKSTNVVRRLFGQEIQCVMHSFGETRACSRDTLELVEDAVRTGVRRVLAEAAAFAVSMATAAGIATTGPVLLEVAHVAHIIRRDPRAMYRFNQTIRLAAEQYGDRPEATELRKYCHNKAAPRPWESIAALADLSDEAGDGSGAGSAAAAAAERQFTQDPWKYCTWKAYHTFRELLPQGTFTDYLKCRSTNLVTGVSRSQWNRLTEQPRFMMFQRWLDLGSDDDVKISLGALYALGHVAWECTGVLTQTALMQMHMDDVQSGVAEHRCRSWSYERHLLAALGHGIATAVLLPLTDTQLVFLRQEVDKLRLQAKQGHGYWRGSKSIGSRSLCPQHIKEALRRTQFEDNVLLSIMRGTYASDSYW